MAFFKKLKERLFKSSSKIDEGLEAIVSDGGEEETLVVETGAAEAEADRQAAEAREAEAARLAAEEEARQEAQAQAERLAAEEAARVAAEEEAAAEAARLAAQQEAARIAAAEEAAAEAARIAAEEEAARLAEEQAAAAEAARRRAAEEAAAEEARLAAERAAAADEAARQEAEAAAARAAEEARLAAEAEAAAQAEAERLAAAHEAARVAAAQKAQEDADRRAAEEAARAQAAEQARLDAEQKAAQEARAQAERDAAEAARVAEEAEAQRLAAEAVPEPAALAPLRTTLTPVAPSLIEDEEETSEPAKKPGLLGRLMGRSAPKTVVRRTLDDDMLEQLEELLITADMGVDTALRVTANMAEGRLGKKLSVAEIKTLMADEVARIMEPVARPLPLFPKTPQVVLVVGVNGSGKTTTIGKLASQFRAAGKKVVIAAGDTFRAAAVEQLQVWGDRAGVPVLTAAQGSDPASLAFDAMAQAQADGADLLLIDTAGRLQNRGDLMEELAKIVRVIRKKDETAPHNTLLVLDATTGQNALSQVKVFQEISDVSGLVMTKLDGTAKGGVLVALADKFGLPIHAIGVGEQIDDLSPFDPEEFADALVGNER